MEPHSLTNYLTKLAICRQHSITKISYLCNKKRTGAGLGGEAELIAVTAVKDDTAGSALITGHVCGVSCLCLAVTGGDDGLGCDVSCLLGDTCGLCVAAMPPSSSALIHKPQSSHNIHRYVCQETQ